MELTIDLIGGKWKSLILWRLINTTLRFSELRNLIPQATAKMLTQQLRDLENNGLIFRKVYPVVPPKVEYSLTEWGQTVIPILNIMCSWGTDFMDCNVNVCTEQTNEQPTTNSARTTES